MNYSSNRKQSKQWKQIFSFCCTGGSNYDEASAFVKEMYVKSAAVINEERGVYPHFTNATDTKNVDLVFGAACEIILQKNLNKAGMT